MSFIQRELNKIEKAIQNTPNDEPCDALRVAQQTLAWVLDPDCFMSPTNHLNKYYGTQLPPTKGTGITFEDTTSTPVN